MIEINENHSPLIRWLESMEETYEELFDFSNWARICLKPDSESRVYIIPSLANSLMDDFHNLDAYYTEDLNNHSIKCHNDGYQERIVQRAPIPQIYLLEIIENLIDSLFIDNIKSTTSTIVKQHHISESKIKKWSKQHAVIKKLVCHDCRGKGALSSIKKLKCNACEGEGFTIDKTKKDVAVCKKCGGLGSKNNTITRECKKCEGLGFKPKIQLIQYSNVRCPSQCDHGYIQFGSDHLGNKIMCSGCDGSKKRKDSFYIFHEFNQEYKYEGEHQFTVAEWKSISIVKLKYFQLSPNKNCNVCIDFSDLYEIFGEYPDCRLLKSLMLDKNGKLKKLSQYLQVNQDGIKFETTCLEFMATLHMGDSPRVDLTIIPMYDCDFCLGSGYHGMYCPTCDLRLRAPDPIDVQPPNPGFIRLYRYIDGSKL